MFAWRCLGLEFIESSRIYNLSKIIIVLIYFEFAKNFPRSSFDEARQMTNVMFNLLEMTPSLRIIMGRSCLKPIKFIVVSQTVSFHLTIIPFGGSWTCKCFHILEEAATGWSMTILTIWNCCIQECMLSSTLHIDYD